jgi:hypothetical protein
MPLALLVAAVYRKFGFVEEGPADQAVRRASGELRDAIDMGLLLWAEPSACRLRGRLLVPETEPLRPARGGEVLERARRRREAGGGL